MVLGWRWTPRWTWISPESPYSNPIGDRNLNTGVHVVFAPSVVCTDRYRHQLYRTSERTANLHVKMSRSYKLERDLRITKVCDHENRKAVNYYVRRISGYIEDTQWVARHRESWWNKYMRNEYNICAAAARTQENVVFEVNSIVSLAKTASSRNQHLSVVFCRYIVQNFINRRPHLGVRRPTLFNIAPVIIGDCRQCGSCWQNAFRFGHSDRRLPLHVKVRGAAR
jgi:hypothetical protein